MVSGLRRAVFARLAVGTTVVLVLVLGAASAQAAVGGALPQSSTFRPDLRSVTLVSSSAAQFCFDKALNGGLIGAAGDFTLGGYQSDGEFTSDNGTTEATSAVLDDSNPDCVDVIFPTTPAAAGSNNVPGSSGSADLNQYTIGTVAVGAVTTNTHAESNDADSTALTGSNTHTGTTGNSGHPDLTGVVIQSSFNAVQYVFNKNIGAVNVAAGRGFYIIDSAGQVCRQGTPAAISFSANVVTVVYPGATTTDCPAFTAFPKSVNAAVRAGVDQDVVYDATADGFTNGSPETAIVPGTSGTTGLADLLSAVVAADGNSVAYTFDKPIGSANPTHFGLTLADGSEPTGTGTATISNTSSTGTVTVSFNQGSQFNEYDVKGFVTPGAATVLNEPSSSNTYGMVPVGDNAGAFARGFTTGPDATAVSFNSAAGQAVINFDQRIDLTGTIADPAGFVLLDSDGTPVAGAAATDVTAYAECGGSGPGQGRFPAGGVLGGQGNRDLRDPVDLGAGWVCHRPG